MIAQLILTPKVGGLSPPSPAKSLWGNGRMAYAADCKSANTGSIPVYPSKQGHLAKLNIASRYEREGWGFESLGDLQFKGKQ